MRIMYSILNILYSNKAQSKLYALTQKDIIEALAADGEGWKERTVYNRLRELMDQELICEGLKKVNAKTFYITQAGIDWMKEMEGDVDNE